MIDSVTSTPTISTASSLAGNTPGTSLSTFEMKTQFSDSFFPLGSPLSAKSESGDSTKIIEMLIQLLGNLLTQLLQKINPSVTNSSGTTTPEVSTAVAPESSTTATASPAASTSTTAAAPASTAATAATASPTTATSTTTPAASSATATTDPAATAQPEPSLSQTIGNLFNAVTDLVSGKIPGNTLQEKLENFVTQVFGDKAKGVMKTAGNVLDGALDVGKDLLTFFLGKRFKWLGKLGKKVGKQVTNWVTKGFKKLSKLF